MVKCDCMCHRKGFMVSHIIPCCGLTYQTYADENGKIDEEKFGKLNKIARKLAQ